MQHMFVRERLGHLATDGCFFQKGGKERRGVMAEIHIPHPQGN